jgi:PAS domain S-box-containing protein
MGESLDPQAEDQHVRRGAAEAASAIRVLLVDDSYDDFVLTRALLRRAGGGPYELEWESSYERGLAALRSQRFQACFLDYDLRPRTGLEMLGELRGSSVETPIIVLTGTSDGAVEREALASGAADYLVKGKFDPESLERAIRHAIERLAASEAMRASERRFRAVFDGALDGMLLWNDAGEYVDGNPAALAIFGVSHAELCRRKVGELGGGSAARFDHSRLLREGTGAGDWEVRGSDGEPHVYEFRSTANILPGVHLTVLRDISSRRMSERMRARVLMSDRMASIGLLAAGVVHEINNPLTAVMAGIEGASEQLASLADGGTAAQRDASDGLRDAFTASERIREIVRDLRLFSRAEEDRRVAVDIRPVLESSLRMAWNEIRHRAVVVKHYADTPTVDASESRLGQVFLNLLVNAAQSIREGNVEGNEIRVVTGVADGRVFVDIEDTGSGISEEKLAQIFEPFFTTKPQGVGTGLGLSICRGIVSEWKGELTISSEVGRGTVARVSLPVGQIAPQPLAAAPGPARVKRRARVLIVDDEAVLVKLFVRALEAEHDVTGVTLAREALARVSAGERYDVILCDLMMPEMTGLQLHSALEKVAPEMARKMVFLTGGVFTQTMRAAVAALTNKRLDKPLAPSRLLTLVRELVE